MTTAYNQNSHIRQDLFDAIQYDRGEKSAGPMGKKLGRNFVFAWIFQAAWAKISVGIATASKGKFHTSRQLFNDEATWLGYDKPIQLAIGRCLAYFVANKMLPLVCVNPTMSNKLYMILGAR